MLLRCLRSSFSFNKAAETTAQASPIYAWKVTSPVFECLKPLAGPEPFGSFSTSKQPHNVPQSLLNLAFKRFYSALRRCERDRTLVWEFI